MMRFLLFLLLVATASAGDYVRITTGRVALGVLDRKYTSDLSVASGWRPLNRAALPASAVEEIQKTRALSLTTWDIADDGSVSAKDPDHETDYELAKTAAAVRVDAERLIELVRVRQLLAAVRTKPPLWASEAVLSQAEAILIERRDLLIGR